MIFRFADIFKVKTLNIPDKLYIEEKVLNHPFTLEILSKLPHVPRIVVDDYKKIGIEKEFARRAEEDKRSLALAEKKGEVIKNIGRMQDGQYYLFHEIDCKYDCEYCYLQYYFQTKIPIIFINRDSVLEKIEEILKTHQNPYFHAGEVCDALAFDNLTEFSKKISPLFNNYQNGTIEFRTKSVNIENLLSLNDIPKNLIPSWTLSPQYINDSIEHGTPSFRERLYAAKKCQDSGFTVGVRLDPIFKYEQWEDDYKNLIYDILTVLNPQKIDCITIGTVKLHKNLLDVIRKRFPSSPVILDEIVPSVDGKYRYIKFVRVGMYRKLVKWIRSLDSDIEIKLSLESDDVKELVLK